MIKKFDLNTVFNEKLSLSYKNYYLKLKHIINNIDRRKNKYDCELYVIELAVN